MTVIGHFHHDANFADGPSHYHPTEAEAEHVALVLTGAAIALDGLDPGGHLRPDTTVDLLDVLAMVVGADMLPPADLPPVST